MSYYDRPSRKWGTPYKKLLYNSRTCLFVEMTTKPCTVYRTITGIENK